MKLKVGDIVEFKKYEDMTDEERFGICKDFFPSFGTIIKVFSNNNLLYIEGNKYTFSKRSVARVISAFDDIDVNSLNPGDEVLMKVTIRKINGNHISFSWVNNNKGDVVKVLKHKEEHFIVKEDHYGMYVNGSGVLIADKRHAKVYNSRIEANEDAADMHLNAWDVIPYDD